MYIKRIVNEYGKNICTIEILEKLGRKVIGSANVKKLQSKINRLVLKIPKIKLYQ